jgi:hypothetical protein
VSIRFLIVPLAAVILFSAGCASLYQPYAREVKKKPQEGGTIALRTEHRPEDRAKADMIMQTNCAGNPIKVTEEGEVVVGEKTEGSARRTTNYDNNAFSIGNVNFGQAGPSDNTASSQERTQIKEWHITYQCVASNSNSEPIVKKGRMKN